VPSRTQFVPARQGPAVAFHLVGAVERRAQRRFGSGVQLGELMQLRGYARTVPP
jgi:hypothetical protein